MDFRLIGKQGLVMLLLRSKLYSRDRGQEIKNIWGKQVAVNRWVYVKSKNNLFIIQGSKDDRHSSGKYQSLRGREILHEDQEKQPGT